MSSSSGRRDDILCAGGIRGSGGTSSAGAGWCDGEIAVVASVGCSQSKGRTVSDGSLCSRSGEGDLGGEVGVGVDGVGVGEDGVDGSSGGSSAGGMSAESGSGGVVDRLVDGGDGCGDEDGGVQQAKGERRRLDSSLSSLKILASLFSCIWVMGYMVAMMYQQRVDAWVAVEVARGTLMGFLWLWNNGDWR